MKVLEYEAKALLTNEGLAVPQSKLVSTAEEAAVVADQIGGPVVVKAQIPSGGRMKAGGIFFSDTLAAALCEAGVLVAEKLSQIPPLVQQTIELKI